MAIASVSDGRQAPVDGDDGAPAADEIAGDGSDRFEDRCARGEDRPCNRERFYWRGQLDQQQIAALRGPASNHIQSDGDARGRVPDYQERRSRCRRRDREGDSGSRDDGSFQSAFSAVERRRRVMDQAMRSTSL